MIKRIRDLIWTCLLVITRLAVVLPLAYIVPKGDLVVFLGEYNGNFSDNVKYLFLQGLSRNGRRYRLCYVTESPAIYAKLRESGFPAALFPGFRAVAALLRAKVFVTDTNRWAWKVRYHLLARAKKVQLWHGVGLKRKIVINNIDAREDGQPAHSRALDILLGRYGRFDLMISTSEFYTENVFSRAAVYDAIIESGYPRNDPLFNGFTEQMMIGTDQGVLKSVGYLREKGLKICVYAPTWREDGADPVSMNVINLPRLSAFAQKNGIVFILKFHHWLRKVQRAAQLRDLKLDNVVFYEPSADIYPLLPYADALVTDYSSIFMDYLLLDKPVIFFPYDYEHYVIRDKSVQFDYDRMTPGPKCYNQASLEKALADTLTGGQDDHRQRRQELARIAFAHHDGKAGGRIWEYIEKNMLS